MPTLIIVEDGKLLKDRADKARVDENDVLSGAVAFLSFQKVNHESL